MWDGDGEWGGQGVEERALSRWKVEKQTKTANRGGKEKE